MRRLVTTIVLLLLVASDARVWSEPSTWAPAGTITVNGKVLGGTSYLKKERRLVFPVLAMANALGKKASYDATTRTIFWDGRNFSLSSLVVVGGTPFATFWDLNKMEPALQYGVSKGIAVFAYNARRTMPAAVDSTSGNTAPVATVNHGDPGQEIDVKNYLVQGKYTVVEFYSEY